MEKKKYFKDKNNNIEENVLDLLSNQSLLNQDCKFNDFYECNIKGEVIDKLTLEDFINNGISFLQQNKNNDNKVATSGDYSKIATSGDDSQVATSGDDSQVATSGDNSKIATSGYYSQVATSGDYSKIATSGYNSQVATSGDYSKIATSGNDSQVATSGYYSQVATSGDDSQVATSGNYSKAATSGDYSQVATSGDYSKVATSGYDNRITINGKKSICFACGVNSMVKSIKGNWVSLAEYNEEYEPIYAKSFQVGKAKDVFNNTTNEEYYYMLVNKKLVPILIIDNYYMVIFSKKILGDYEIFKTQYIRDYKKGKEIKQYVVKKNEFTAHGKTIKDAIKDIEFKYLQSQDIQEHIKRVKEQGYITPNDYRLLTGACRYGTNKWLEENNFTWEDKKTIEEVIELTKGQYGNEKIKEIFN